MGYADGIAGAKITIRNLVLYPAELRAPSARLGTRRR